MSSSQTPVPGSRPSILFIALLILCGLGLGVFGYRVVGRRGEPAPEPAPVAQAPVPAVAAAAEGPQLYAHHCAACHGDRGDGNGPAARFLYPKPRNFRDARFRVVTAANLRPTDEDLLQVITRGMPGSAMFAFGHLSEDQRRALVGHVRQLVKDGLLDRQRAELGANADLTEVARDIDQLFAESRPIDVPADLLAYGPESVARGARLYASEGCVSCHGPTGKGDGAQEQRDDLGVPIRPRDLTRGFFKGSPEPQQLYARLLLGMPGTPMPASPKLKPNDVGDMVNYILSLSDAATRARVEHRRVRLVAGKVAGSLPEDASAGAWSAAREVPVVVSPLWWREYDDPNLRVAALTDGKMLAIRMSWQDATGNDEIARPEDFEDMAAVQLFQGTPEPFLGMGAADRRIDLWLWRASWQHPPSTTSLLDGYPFDEPLFTEMTKGREKQNPDMLTARAAGNLNANPDRATSASSLVAGGFGSTTFRPRASQLVTARAAWKDGHWTLVLRRPLAVGADDGLSLAANGRYAIAFAVWDGTANDRNGQKLVSVWHDLEVE